MADEKNRDEIETEEVAEAESQTSTPKKAVKSPGRPRKRKKRDDSGISDDLQRLCLALALGDGKDPNLQERLFGLTNSQGSHAQEVKEYDCYLDRNPVHSYMQQPHRHPRAAYRQG